MSTGRCNNCEKTLPKEELKQCSGCHLIKYCSRECQKAAWPRHKRSCGGIVKARQEFLHSGDATAADEYTTITKWAACWQETIIMLGMFGMDLANHPDDRMNTHVVYIEVEFRKPRPQERARWLRMTSGKIMPRKALIARLAASGIPAATLLPLQPMPGAARDVLQIALACGDLFRSFKCGINHYEMWKGAEKAMSRARAESWDAVLQAKIEKGEPFPAF